MAAQALVQPWVEHVEPGPEGAEQAPPAAFRCFPVRAALHDRAPIGRDVIHVHPRAAQHVMRHLPQPVERRQVGGAQQHHLLSIVAGGREVALHLVHVARAGQRLHPRVGGHRRARREEAHPLAPQAAIRPRHRGHEIRLRDGAQQRAAHRRLVEGRMQMVEPRHAEQPGRVQHVLHHIAVAAHLGLQIGGHLFPPIHLAPHHGGGGGGGVGDGVPLYPIQIHALRPGGPAWRPFRARHIALEARIGGACAGHAFGGQEAEGPRPDQIPAQRLARILAREAFGHDEADRGGGLAQRLEQHGEGALQPEQDGAVIGRRELIRERHQHLAQRIAGGPAADGGDAIPRPHRIPIVEAQPFAQLHGDAAALILHHMEFDHLRMRLVVGVEPIQRVPHHVGVVARDIGRGDDGIEDREVGLGDILQQPRGTLRPLPQRRRAEGGGPERGPRAGEDLASLHIVASAPITPARSAPPGRIDRRRWADARAVMVAQPDTLSRMIPPAIIAIPPSFMAVAVSPSTRMPMAAVPTAPMPVQMA